MIEYLSVGLTGARLKGSDCEHASISTHTIHSSNLEKVEKRLSQLSLRTSPAEVADCIKQFQIKLDPFSLQDQMSNIEKYFARPERGQCHSL